MTKIKILLLLLVGFLGLTTTADAGLSDLNSYIRPTKLSIYGHTGQDPVHKKFGGDDDSKFPFGQKPKHNPVESLSVPISDILVKEFVQDNATLFTGYSDVSPSTLEFPYPLDPIGYNPSSLHVGGAVPGTIPSPPAFLLLASGFFCRRRRTS